MTPELKGEIAKAKELVQLLESYENEKSFKVVGLSLADSKRYLKIREKLYLTIQLI